MVNNQDLNILESYNETEGRVGLCFTDWGNSGQEEFICGQVTGFSFNCVTVGDTFVMLEDISRNSVIPL